MDPPCLAGLALRCGEAGGWPLVVELVEAAVIAYGDEVKRGNDE